MKNLFNYIKTFLKKQLSEAEITFYTFGKYLFQHTMINEYDDITFTNTNITTQWNQYCDIYGQDWSDKLYEELMQMHRNHNIDKKYM